MEALAKMLFIPTPESIVVALVVVIIFELLVWRVRNPK